MSFLSDTWQEGHCMLADFGLAVYCPETEEKGFDSWPEPACDINGREEVRGWNTAPQRDVE